MAKEGSRERQTVFVISNTDSSQGGANNNGRISVTENSGNPIFAVRKVTGQSSSNNSASLEKGSSHSSSEKMEI